MNVCGMERVQLKEPLTNKSSVIALLLYAVAERLVVILQHLGPIILVIPQLLLLFLGHVLLQDTEALQQPHLADTVYQ